MMGYDYKRYLFNKEMFVSVGEVDQNTNFETIFSLASLFNIEIVEGMELAQPYMIELAAEMLGRNVPEPFYKGFPQSVRQLSRELRLLDQCIHYIRTYGLNQFYEAGHSLFEETIQRAAFNEQLEVKKFKIITEKQALELMDETAVNLLKSSRPLNDEQLDIVVEYVRSKIDINQELPAINSKNTVIKLMAALKNLSFTRYLMLSDVIKYVDHVNEKYYENTNIKDLNLKNKDRRFITELIDRLFEEERCDLETCFEKKKIWNGLLHHIHYKPKTQEAEHFVNAVRSKGNLSAYAQFEKLMSKRDVNKAVKLLMDKKGTSDVLRHLDYIASRVKNLHELKHVLCQVKSKNVILLLQLLLHYETYTSDVLRTFVFTRYNRLINHKETHSEAFKRKTVLSEKHVDYLKSFINNQLATALKNRVGKVYIDESMKKVALPIQENTSQSGNGVLAKGTRIPVDMDKKIRAFTYWEKVNDIDLSAFGMTDDHTAVEFSWRTFASELTEGIDFSGDETSGYFGGSEYIDFEIELFKKSYPEVRYIIVCNNVFSKVPFDQCVCRAGYMIRDIEDSGEVFEPSTVATSFAINCHSINAYLFGLDLEKREFVWLNLVSHQDYNVAGEQELDFLERYFHITETMNIYKFFELCATEIVDDPLMADIIVSDDFNQIREGKEVIHSYDFDKLHALMNN